MLDLSKYLKLETLALMTNKHGRIITPALLTGNTKLDKSNQINVGMALLPADTLNLYLHDHIKPVVTACPTAAAHGCLATCIGTKSGHYSMEKGSARMAQIKRALMFTYDLDQFKVQLLGEVAGFAAKAMVSDGRAFIRLDVFSDNKKANGELIRFVMAGLGVLAKFVVWYDYTKIHNLKGLNLPRCYADNLALSVSQNALKGPLRTKFKKALPLFKYSAIVVPEASQSDTVQALNLVPNVRAVNGDQFDNFTEHSQGGDSSHIVLVLKTKGTAHKHKNEANDNFALTTKSAYELYLATFGQFLFTHID